MHGVILEANIFIHGLLLIEVYSLSPAQLKHCRNLI